MAQALGLYHYALWLHDYGSQIGLRHAIAHPDRIASLIIQNGDIYEDVLGPKYATIKAWWEDKTPEKHRPLEEAVSEEGFRAEFVGEVGGDVAERVPPDLWKLHWPLMDTPVRRKLSIGLMEKLEANLAWFPRYQAYLRQHRPPTLIVWGPEDGYMPAESARAYRRDLPDAELHLLDGAGHWLLETHFGVALPLVRAFLAAAPYRLLRRRFPFLRPARRWSDLTPILMGVGMARKRQTKKGPSCNGRTRRRCS